MAIKKKKTKKIVSIICIILVVALVVGSAFAIKQKKSTVEVSLSTISTDDIVETVNATGKVTAGAVREYRVDAVATCKEVFVKVGDKVKKGDTLATFDTSSLDNEIASLQKTYSSTEKAYEDAVKKQKIAQKNLNNVNKKIKELEEKLKEEEKKNPKKPQSAPNGNTATGENATPSLPTDSISNEIEDLEKEIEELIKNVNDLATDVEGFTATVDMLIAQLKEMADNDLSETELELARLYVERELYTLEASPTVANTQKQALDSIGSAISGLKNAKGDLAQGWSASIDGVVTECNLASGVKTSTLETGIKIENMSSMVTTISLGEYDIQKVKVGMPATITTAYGTYSGEISFIAPTATGGSSGSILDNVGSMAGISGLSSLTASGAGVECTVTIEKPDKNIIVGFDADVEISTGSYVGVPVVPIESIVLEKEGTFVYLYNEEEGTVTKTQIKTGAISDSAYEIKEGIKLGDKIVSTPSAEYEEETFKVKVTAKK